jgi:hypothetical protein
MYIWSHDTGAGCDYSANTNFTGQNLTSEFTGIFTTTSFINRPIPYSIDSVCGATVIYPSANTHLDDFDLRRLSCHISRA